MENWLEVPLVVRSLLSLAVVSFHSWKILSRGE